MRAWFEKPWVLLLATGLVFGLNFPLGKLAVAAGIAPSLWAAYISLGAGLVLLPLSWAHDAWPEDRVALTRFSFLSGFLSFVMPGLITYSVITHIGSGLASLMFALSPMITALLAWAFKVRPPSALALAGIGLGFVGAVIIVFGKDQSGITGISPWLLLALCTPLFLASGNIYRSTGWPPGAGPRLLGSFTNLAAVPFLVVIAFVIQGGIDLRPALRVPGLLLAQLISSSIMFALFFRLQQVGGPTYLSQIGYVGAAVGLFAGVAFLGETYPLAVWIGVAVIAAGIILSSLAARRPN